ncbi:YbfB/YjiJ family MFS transporter [Sulfurospirillum oryzae]|uniref:YbfB/YjiJ family MFS transporter n=1 Tax=Sulfurospirillum oryzae TaxID=2976535 RepID=UPI0021E9619A|nr:YbfB/YjiJ family MFS transporter [Sulfurospirillum oryzae]
MAVRAHLQPIVAGILVVFACLGLARFAFGMILPSMQGELLMNATEAGIVGSANFVGYFIGLFVTSQFYRKFGAATLITRSLLTQAISMIFMALAPNYWSAAMIFAVTGFFGAQANIAIMTYIAQVVPSHIKGQATGLVVAGIGCGIITSGIIVPYLEFFPFPEWRVGWSLFALIIVLIAWFAHGTLKAFPIHSSLSSHHDSLEFKTILSSRAFLKTGVLFGIFGMTAIMFMTFFVLTAVRKWGVSTEISGTFWSILGIASLFSGPLFGFVSDRMGRYKTLGILFLVQATAHAMLASTLPSGWLFVSATLFGLSTWAVPSIMATLSTELFGTQHTARILSLLTLFFGVGQIVGPLLSGIMIDFTGDFSVSFITSALCLLGAMIISWISL